MSGERRLDRQANDEPSLGMSVVLLCVVLFTMFAIVGNFSIPMSNLCKQTFWLACDPRGHNERAGRPLLDHLVGCGQQRIRDGNSERLGGLEVDDELEFGRKLDGQLARLRTAQNAVDIR